MKLNGKNYNSFYLGGKRYNKGFLNGKQIFGSASEFIKTGLTWHIDMQNPLSFDGTNIIKDISGNGLNGTLNGVITPNVKGLSFNGINNFINFGDILDVGTSDFSMTIWAKFNPQSGLKGIIGKNAYGAMLGRYGIYQISTNNISGFVEPTLYTNIESQNITGSTKFSQFNSYTMVYKRNEGLLFYINGIFTKIVSNVNSTNLNTSGNFYVGVYGNASGTSPQVSTYTSMIFGEAFTNNIALTAEQVLQNHNALKNKYL